MRKLVVLADVLLRQDRLGSAQAPSRSEPEEEASAPVPPGTDAQARSRAGQPTGKLQGTEHRALAGRCGSCGSLPRAAFPEGVPVPVQDGPRLAAAAVDLRNAPCLPEERLAEIFRDPGGVAVCAAPRAGLSRRVAERWRDCPEQVRDRIARAAGVQPLDETGFRVGGQTQGLPGLSTPPLTFSRPSVRRGSLVYIGPPARLAALRLHASNCGVYASRRSARGCAERRDCLAGSGLQRPDCRTLSACRQRHLQGLGGCSTQFCGWAGTGGAGGCGRGWRAGGRSARHRDAVLGGRPAAALGPDPGG